MAAGELGLNRQGTKVTVESWNAALRTSGAGIDSVDDVERMIPRATEGGAQVSVVYAARGCNSQGERYGEASGSWSRCCSKDGARAKSCGVAHWGFLVQGQRFLSWPHTTQV